MPRPADAGGLAGLLLVLLTCGLPALAAAAATQVGPIRITVPAGFEAAQTQRLAKTWVTGWTKSVPDGSMKTLLQVNVVDLGRQPAGAEKYLREFLSNIERRRSNYVSSPVAHIKLAGLPAVRATWNGASGGRALVGVMYSVIVRNRFAVIFHTQDLGSTPTDGMLEAMSSIESVSLADEGGAATAADQRL